MAARAASAHAGDPATAAEPGRKRGRAEGGAGAEGKGERGAAGEAVAVAVAGAGAGAGAGAEAPRTGSEPDTVYVVVRVEGAPPSIEFCAPDTRVAELKRRLCGLAPRQPQGAAPLRAPPAHAVRDDVPLDAPLDGSWVVHDRLAEAHPYRECRRDYAAYNAARPPLSVAATVRLDGRLVVDEEAALRDYGGAPRAVLEARLEEQPPLPVPWVTLHGSWPKRAEWDCSVAGLDFAPRLSAAADPRAWAHRVGDEAARAWARAHPLAAADARAACFEVRAESLGFRWTLGALAVPSPHEPAAAQPLELALVDATDDSQEGAAQRPTLWLERAGELWRSPALGALRVFELDARGHRTGQTLPVVLEAGRTYALELGPAWGQNVYALDARGRRHSLRLKFKVYFALAPEA